MKKYFVFIVLTCLLGNRALAQTRSASNTSFTHEFYDFSNIEATTTTVWSGDQEFGPFSGTRFDIANTQFNVSEGDIIRVSFSPANNNTPGTDGGPEGRFKPYQGWSELIAVNNIRYGNGYYEATITGTASVNGNTVNVVDYINNNGLGIQAAYMTITSVQIISMGSLTWNGNNLVAFAGNSLPKADRISVDNTSGYSIGISDANSCSYLQSTTQGRLLYINNLNVGDIVRIWCAGECRVLTDNTASHDSDNPLVWTLNDPDLQFNQQNNNQFYDRNVNDREGALLDETFNYLTNPSPIKNELKIVNDHNNGTLVIRLASQWAGIIKVEIDAVESSPRFDYDPGFEVYDMWATKIASGSDDISATESAGFELNNNNAYYLKLSNSDLTLNERIAVSPATGWSITRGLQAPGYGVTNDSWNNLSICNLRVGDRVVIYYSGDAPIFSSNGKNGGYTGNAAYMDTWNDGMFDANEGDHEIKNGDPVEYTYCRKEGTFGNEEGSNHIWLYTSYPYVMKENGHLDLALRNGNYTRIVKIKIYSDHQAMMVDDYIDEDYSYKAYYNITGELEAKEHIVPGGLEVHVGNDNANQNAIVVFSKEGPVSYVKAEDGFKLPGITKVNGVITNDFSLADHAPATGTYYRFIPEINGTMTVRFKAASLNYYRWDLAGDAIYFDDQDHPDFNGNSGWSEEFDRANEWSIDRDCPYYLKVQDGDQYYQPDGLKVSYNDGASFSDVGTNTLQIRNGNYCTLTLNVVAGKTYYLYGAWSGSSYITISPRDDNNWISNDNHTKRDACGVAELLWVKFDPNDKVYPLAKWVPNNTTKVNDDSDGGVPNPDTYEIENKLADVIGYNRAPITVKKMSDNIIACRPYIKRQGNNPDANEGELMIDGIQFIDKNKGGTILIKIGDPDLKTSPLYALTIAYSAQNKGENGQVGNNDRGHTWDLTTNSLYGMKWEEGLETEVVIDDQGHPVIEDGKEKIRYKFIQSQAPDYETTFTTITGGYATPTPYGTYFKNYYANESNIADYSKAEDVLNWFKSNDGINTGKSLLEEEIDYNDDHGIGRSDWMFNYNLVYGDKLYDPIFTNKYDMEGDNADMVWDTEGLVFRTSANQSVIFNEYVSSDDEDELNTIDHASTKDPDRYVGIKEGGEFRIPWLEKNDRVIIWMGTGKGPYADEVKFNIRNAYDAVHNLIDESDDYVVGGSQWTNGSKNYDYYGCYHFFATGSQVTGHVGEPADMVFKMKEGTLCKIYKIQIYRGDRIITNEIVGKTEDDNKYFLWSRAADPNDESTANYLDENYYNWTLKYLGKDQQLANGTGKNTQENEIIAQTGKYNSTPALTNNRVDTEDNTSKVESFTYKHSLGEIGTFRMRGKDMEKNMNYVADYADHNVTIAYQQTQLYPYTWDFTDVTGIESNVTNYFDKEEKLGEGDTAPAGSGLTNDVWNSLDAESYQKTARDLSLWEVFGTAGNYFLRLNSQTSQTPQNLMERDNIFESAKEIGGNQVWANKTIVPEMKGLWFYTENYDPETHKSYDNLQSNGEWIIKQGDANNPGGLEFKKGNCDWFNKIVVPNVPNNAAVYMRMRKLTTTPAKVRYMFGQQVSMSELPKNTTSTSGTTRTTETLYSIGNGDYIVAIMNTTGSKSNLTLSLDGFRVQKLAVSTDPKQIGKTGYTTESRKHQIDHTLTAELTGKPIKAYTATYAGTATAPDYKTMVLTEISNKTRHNMEAATSNGGFTGCILYNDVTDDDKSVSILDGGFHLFVPDMHDGYGDNTQDVLLVSDDNKPLNVLKSFLPQDNYFTYYTTVSQVTSLGEDHFLLPDEGSDKTLILSARKYKYGTDPTNPDNVTELTEVSFVRVDPNGFGGKGAFLNKCSAYIVMPADQMKVLNSTNGAKVNVVFESDLFDMNDGIATGVTTIPAENASDTDTYYTLSGMKINRPTQSGLYIKNGKKVYVK